MNFSNLFDLFDRKFFYIVFEYFFNFVCFDLFRAQFNWRSLLRSWDYFTSNNALDINNCCFILWENNSHLWKLIFPCAFEDNYDFLRSIRLLWLFNSDSLNLFSLYWWNRLFNFRNNVVEISVDLNNFFNTVGCDDSISFRWLLSFIN